MNHDEESTATRTEVLTKKRRELRGSSPHIKEIRQEQESCRTRNQDFVSPASYNTPIEVVSVTVREHPYRERTPTTSSTRSAACLLYYFIGIVAPLEMAKQTQFNLHIPTEDDEPKKNFRLARKSFAIVCQTNVTSKIL